MTRERSPGPGSPLDGPSDPERRSTLRSIEAAEPIAPDSASSEDESLAVPVYVEPQPLIAVSDHKTLEMESVRLAHDIDHDIDPRKLPTELRLARPSRIVPDSDWPQADVVAVRSQPRSSQPPLAGRRNWRTPLVLLMLLGALTLLVLAVITARRSPAAHTPSVAAPSEASRPAVEAVAPPSLPPHPTPEPSLPSAPESAAVEAAPAPEVAPAPEAAPSASSSLPSLPPSLPSLPPSLPSLLPSLPESAAKRAPSPHSSVKSNSRLGGDAASRAPAVPTASKPKRAIY